MPASGLAKIDDARRWRAISTAATEELFFVSRFVDYSERRRLFRKYRVVFVDGQPYACHMAIADRWDIWYLNADMSHSAEKRLEEETFMRTFDIGFGRTASGRARRDGRAHRPRIFHHRLRGNQGRRRC